MQVTESPKSHIVDVLASLMVETVTEQVGREPWAARTFDLKDAYRQCAVCPSSSKFAHIALKNPKDGGSSILWMLALPFCSIKSVHSLLKVAHSLWFILVAHLDILVTNYFHDFVVLRGKLKPVICQKICHRVRALLAFEAIRLGLARLERTFCSLAHLYPAAALAMSLTGMSLAGNRWLGLSLADYVADWLSAGWFCNWLLAGWLAICLPM